MKQIHSRFFHGLLLLVFFLGHTQCSLGQRTTGELNSSKEKKQANFQFPYTLQEPDKVFKLPNKLVEISGLSLSDNPQYLVAVQDEDGIVFLINKATGEVEETIPFGKTGDYEGIEMVGADVYIVKSSGKIYAVKDAGQESRVITKYKTPLNKEFDVEGLTYDSKSNALLLACKGQPDALEEETQFAKAIYAFQLDSMVFDSIPVVIFDQQEILTYFETHPPLIKTKKDGSTEELAPKKIECHPSAMAIHPLDGNYYICSSKGKTLFVLSPEGKLLHIEKLSKKVHPQPEGIVIDKDGTLFISSEGDEDRKARISVFNYPISVR